MLYISHNDVPGLSGVYAIIKLPGSASGVLVDDGWGFDNINDYNSYVYFFALYLTEITPGYYATGYRPIDGLGNDVVLPSILNAEIYRISGFEPRLGLDYLLSYGQINYDGHNDAGDLKSPKIDNSPNYIGNITIPAPIFVYTRLINEFGVPGYADQDIMGYQIHDSSGSIVTTGYLTSLGGGAGGNFGAFYKKNLSSSFFNEGNYSIQISGKRNKIPAFGYQNFDVKMPDQNLISSLGYVTGFVRDLNAGSGSFKTSLPSTINDHYNGQVLRFTSGTLMGQPRIISEYQGSDKTLTFHKSFESVPSSGWPFVIFPIGGEYNVN